MTRDSLVLLAIALMVAMGCAAPAFTPGDATLPIRWTEHMDLSSDDPSQLDALLDGPVDIHTDHALVMTRDDREASPRTGREWLALRDEGYAPLSSYDTAKESWFVARALPLRFLSRAHHARESFVHDLDLARDPLSVLPAALGEVLADPDRATDGTWKKAFPTSTFAVRAAQSVEIDDHEGSRTIVTLLAWADFDGDGIEDVLVLVSAYATEGTAAAHFCAVLTRRTPEGPLTLLNAE